MIMPLKNKFVVWSPKSLDLGVSYLFICIFLTHKSKDLGLQTMNLRCPKIMNTPPQNLLEIKIL